MSTLTKPINVKPLEKESNMLVLVLRLLTIDSS